ncbi:glycosyltransferase family 4 protein [Kitasatospora viridis]|uniref:Glycosyltransferase involved in cell wall biosynthesis n=1 Tax=Kitasatospora viridis TaxID=281105 RepID=A0A561T617_9ACTN|nr:glycosyltransferase family 4 protein [Kitasatospora viridis]TWF82551.1 glycosyltransferase involved in cell wall biosynthesis [Kitasatospora viridis]
MTQAIEATEGVGGTTGSRPPGRVLLVSHYYPPHVGGIENVVHQEAAQLTGRGGSVTVLTTGGRRAAADLEAGVRVLRCAAWNGIERRTGVPFPVPSPRLLVDAVREARRAEVIHLHDCLYPTSWAAWAASVLTRTPLVLTQHVALVAHPSPLVRGVQRAVYAVFGRALLRRARRVLVLNDTVRAFTRAHGARPQAVRQLANGVDTARFRPAESAEEVARLRDRYGLPADRVLVLFVGRLVPKKGYELLRKAADPAYDLVFVGTGAAADGQDAAEGAHHLGALTPDQVAEVYRACDVFALPSTAEGFPLTVQEAMAAGLPVVTTDDPGYTPYALDREAVSLLPRDAGRLRAELVALAADPPRRRRMGRWSRSYAERSFGWPEHVRALLGHYAAAGAGGAGRAAGGTGAG